MIASLMGLEEPTEAENPIDLWRLAIMKFLKDHWAKVEPQLSCPAKSGDDRACFQCVDAQVITCVVQNKDNEHLIYRKLISLRRK